MLLGAARSGWSSRREEFTLASLLAMLRQTLIPAGDLSPCSIQAVGVEDGALRIEFPPEQSFLGDRITRQNPFRVVLKFGLKPRRCTPLSTADEREIWRRRPDLRQDCSPRCFPPCSKGRFGGKIAPS